MYLVSDVKGPRIVLCYSIHFYLQSDKSILSIQSLIEHSITAGPLYERKTTHSGC